MKRSIKNIIMILIIIVMGVLSYFTMKDIQNTNNSSTAQPQMPTQNQGGDNSNMGEPPAKPEGENDNQNMGEPPARPDEQNGNQSQIKTIHYIMFGMEGFISSIFAIYLIMSKFNKIGLKDVLSKSSNVVVFIVLIIIFTILLTIAKVAITNKLFVTEKQVEQREMQMMPGGNSLMEKVIAEYKSK